MKPEHQIIFRAHGVDDRGVQITRSFRVTVKLRPRAVDGRAALPPERLPRDHHVPGFEQTFTNALTCIPIGGGKGGSDFDPKGHSTADIIRVCQSFLTKLSRHIGEYTDVPAAGDIGVDGREIGYLFGQKRITNCYEAGVITGKRLTWGGSQARRRRPATAPSDSTGHDTFRRYAAYSPHRA